MTHVPYAALIEGSLERVAERCEDPTPLVYERLFTAEIALVTLASLVQAAKV